MTSLRDKLDKLSLLECDLNLYKALNHYLDTPIENLPHTNELGAMVRDYISEQIDLCYDGFACLRLNNNNY